MSTKTKLQLEMELKEAQATIAKLEHDLQKVRVSGEEEQPTDKYPTKKPQREEDFLKLLEILPVGVSILDDKRKVVFQNSALSQILDINAEGIRTGAYKNRKYLAPDGTAMLPDGFASVQAEKSGQAVYNVETGVIKENGETIWTSVSAVPTDIAEWKTVIVTTDITERKQTEVALQQSEEKYSALFEKSAIPAALTKLPEAVFVDINEAFQSVYGYSRAEVIGKTSLEIGMTLPAEHAQTASELEKHNFLRDNEKHLFTKSGEARIGSINVSKVKIDGQDFVITTIHDITERKQSEQKLRESEVLLRQVLESIPDSTFAIDLNYRFLVDNQRHQQELIASGGNPFKVGEEILSPDYPPEVLSFWRTAYDRALAGETFSLEGSWVDANGQLHVHENRFSPLHDAADRIIGAIVVAHDITERKQAEDALWKSEQRFRAAIKPSFMVLAQTDLNARYTWMHNPHPDFNSDYVVGKTDIELADNEGTQMLYQSKLRVIATGQGIQTEIGFPVSDGLRVYDIIIDPFYDVDGKLLGVTTSSYDITERKRIEIELRRSNAELEQFAYIASHDLQEPLRAVAGMVQLLQRRYQGKLDERADEYIRHAVEASARMQSLIQALLSYSRVQRENQPVELVDAGTCLQMALRNLDASIQESHAIISADALPNVHVNATQLTQLFQNLIGNGIKFQGVAEPQIHISVTKLKDAWQFSIRDNGIGIEPQYFERIFLIFQRLHTQREYAGTGIGLALCKKIIDRHGGRIWVESEPQRGSTFHFTIPFRSKL